MLLFLRSTFFPKVTNESIEDQIYLMNMHMHIIIDKNTTEYKEFCFKARKLDKDLQDKAEHEKKQSEQFNAMLAKMMRR